MQKRSTKSEKLIKEVRRNTRQVFNSEQKILIVMEGMRGEMTVAELCRKHAISEPTYYKWNKEFIEAGKKRLSGDEIREATSDEVKELRKENAVLKESLADLVIRYDIVKKSLNMLE
jgi:transposase